MLIDDRLLDDRRKPSALEGWILEILFCDPKGSGDFMRILPTEEADYPTRPTFLPNIGRKLKGYTLDFGPEANPATVLVLKPLSDVQRSTTGLELKLFRRPQRPPMRTNVSHKRRF